MSHGLYQQGTGMLFVCPVYPDSGGVDHPMFVRCLVAGAPAVIISDHVYRMPAAGLGDAPVGAVDSVTLEYIRAQIRGIFS